MVDYENMQGLDVELGAKEEAFERDLAAMRLRYKMGKIPKINAMEHSILEFCDRQGDMKTFLKEEFENHPIILDDNGGLVYSWYREHPEGDQEQNRLELERERQARVAAIQDEIAAKQAEIESLKSDMNLLQG